MLELSNYILDIVENGIKAKARLIEVNIEENAIERTFMFSITDDGNGIKNVSSVFDPFFTSKANQKVGLGIPLLKDLAEKCDGYLTIESNDKTIVKALFKSDSVNFLPLGDLATSIEVVLLNSKIDVNLTYRFNNHSFFFSSIGMKRDYADLISIRDSLKKQIEGVRTLL